MSELMQLERLTVSGTPRQMGQAQGEHLRERVRKFTEVRFEYLAVYAAARGRTHVEDVLALGRASMEATAAFDPEAMQEHLGLAEAAGVDPVRLHTAANLTDMRDVLLYQAVGSGAAPDDEGCTATIIPAASAAERHIIGGQTWDLNVKDVEFVVAIERRPVSGLKWWTVTCAGCLTLMGLNEAGVGVGTTNIKTWGSKPSIGYLNILHRAIREPSAEAASAIVESADHAGAHTFWIVDERDAFEWEVIPGAPVRTSPTRALGRTNHCLIDVHLPREAEPPSESSEARYGRVSAMLEQAAGDIGVETLKGIFADRSQGALSINRYPDDGELGATNAVFIAVPARREAYACRGPADRGEWVTLGF